MNACMLSMQLSRMLFALPLIKGGNSQSFFFVPLAVQVVDVYSHRHMLLVQSDLARGRSDDGGANDLRSGQEVSDWDDMGVGAENGMGGDLRDLVRMRQLQQMQMQAMQGGMFGRGFARGRGRGRGFAVNGRLGGFAGGRGRFAGRAGQFDQAELNGLADDMRGASFGRGGTRGGGADSRLEDSSEHASRARAEKRGRDDDSLTAAAKPNDLRTRLASASASARSRAVERPPRPRRGDDDFERNTETAGPRARRGVQREPDYVRDGERFSVGRESADGSDISDRTPRRAARGAGAHERDILQERSQDRDRDKRRTQSREVDTTRAARSRDRSASPQDLREKLRRRRA